MTPTAPLRPFVPTRESLETLWHHFDTNRAFFGDELPTSPFDFVLWIAADNTRVFEIGLPDALSGVFIFTGIIPGDSAWAHIFVWDRDTYSHAAVVTAARHACAAMFEAFSLRRILGLTPGTNAPARVFAQRVGFKMVGRLRSAVLMGGMPTDAWVSDLLPSDLAPPATIEEAAPAAAEVA